MSDSYTCDDAFLSARNGDANHQWTLQVAVAGTCGAGLEQDAKDRVTSRQKQDSRPCPEERSQHSRDAPPQPVFIMDSGATCHVTGDCSLFSSPVTPADSPTATYQARDGRQLVVFGVGTISSGNFHIPDVQYVPDLRATLVSVSQLAELGYGIMFGGGQCHVRDQSKGKMVGKGRWNDDDGLYHLEFLKIPPDTTDSTDTGALRCHPAIS
ncbi:unnamed protein product [Urochloa humidicola]